jgi:fatty-acyl-CoA synthase
MSTGNGLNAARPQARTLMRVLTDWAASQPSSPAFISGDRTWTYRDWYDEARQVAGALVAAGVTAGDNVALLAPNSARWASVAVGCAAVGARLVPVNTWSKSAELSYLLEFTTPKVLFAVSRFGRQDFAAQLGEVLGAPDCRQPSIVALDPWPEESGLDVAPFEQWLGTDEAPDIDQAGPSDVTLILFTSGSTARPKGVGLAQGHLIDNGWEIGERQGLDADDRIYVAAPFFWALGSANALMAALTHGAALVLTEQFDANQAIREIERHQCTGIYLLTPMVHSILASPEYTAERLASLRTGLTFGPPGDVRRVIEVLGVDEICNLYGSTEVYGNCIVSPHDAPAEHRVASSGPPLPGVELKIVNPADTLAPCPAGLVGEILVRGRITQGYLTSAGDFDPIVDAEGWFATGDLGSIDEDGWLTFASRASEMIKTSGINVSPAEVEDVLQSHPDIAEVAVVGRAHEIRGEEIIAFVRAQPGARLAADDVRQWAADRMASYKVPATVSVVVSLPTTDTGKIAKRALKDQAQHL